MTENTARPIAPSGFQPNLRVIPGAGPGGGDLPEYIRPERSGLDSGFYVTDRGLPWHVTLSRRLNTPELMEGYGRPLTVGEALVAAGLDWEVEKVPLFAQVGDQMVPCPGRVATIRKDTGAVLGVGLTDRFQPYQNLEAFAFGDHIIFEGGASCESGGSLFGGRQVFLSMELPDHIQVEGDPSDYRLFLLITNGHDGSAMLRVSVTVERAICRNTIRIAHARAVSSWAIRHTKGLQGRVQEARNALGLTQRYVEAFTESASALVRKPLVDRQVDAILAELFPLTEAQQERVDLGKDPGAAALLPVVRMVYQESPTVAPVRGTAYGVLSAVTEFVDHVKTYQKVAQGGADDNRAAHVIFDEGQQDPKQRAWDILTSLS